MESTNSISDVFACADADEDFGQSFKMSLFARDEFLPRIVFGGKWPAFSDQVEKIVSRRGAVKVGYQDVHRLCEVVK